MDLIEQTAFLGETPRLPDEWTFWADTVVGATPLGPVQPVAFSCNRLLSDFGKGEVTLPVDNPALDQERMLRLWSWRLWCLYGGRVYFCGVPTGIVDEGGSAVTLTLTELTGYLDWRQWDAAGETRYNQIEQTTIARNIALPVQDVGVSIVTEPGPGVLRDRSYQYLESEHRSQLLINLSQVGQAENQAAGPQFRTEYGMSGGLPTCTLRIAYPRVGGPTGLGVAADVMSPNAAWDADNLRTRTFAVGELPEDAAEGTPVPVAVVDRPQPDLPRLDRVDDYPSVILTSTLRERANTASVQYAAPTLALTASTPIHEPPLESYGPGDDVTVRLFTPLLAGGLEITGQLQGISVNAGDSTAEWTVAVTLPPPQPRRTLSQRLNGIDLLMREARRGLAALP